VPFQYQWRPLESVVVTLSAMDSAAVSSSACINDNNIVNVFSVLLSILARAEQYTVARQNAGNISHYKNCILLSFGFKLAINMHESK
jgi:hypothetical protein